MRESTNILENIHIFQLSQKHLIFEMSVAKEIEILIARDFNVCILVSTEMHKVSCDKFSE